MRLAEMRDVFEELRWQVLVHAAGTNIIGMHAGTARPFIEAHQLLAFLEAPERRGQGAHVHRLRGDVEEMRKETADLGIEDTDQLAALRHGDAEKLLNGESKGMLLVHRR